MLTSRIKYSNHSNARRWIGLCFALFFSLCSSSYSQSIISHIQPDALGPGMTISMELLAPAKDTGAFGQDGIYLPQDKIAFVNPLDSFRVVFGPVLVSWHGRVMQVPVMVTTNSTSGNVQFQVIVGNRKTPMASFNIVSPAQMNLNGSAILGTGGIYGSLSFGNTLVVDALTLAGTDIINKGVYTFSTLSPFTGKVGNLRYHPITILSKGTVNFLNVEMSVSADTINGGPGGGGGGHGFAGSGGVGYTGGGSDSNYSDRNVGSGDTSTIDFGGASSTGVVGGASSNFNSDQGGGGGTGCPYGSSGVFSSGNDTSQAGGYGGGSAGGEAPGIVYGGGGGAFGTDGQSGAGIGSNGGRSYGGRFLFPMQGGSGGGAGNALQGSDSTAGSGGGGGGAIAIISYDRINLSQSNLFARGSRGTQGVQAQEAGGGGGSGGGIFIGSRNGLSLNQVFVDAAGGFGGAGGTGIENTAKGGNGGLGRIRVDGPYIDTLCTDCFINAPILSGPTVQQSPTRLQGPFANIFGVAGSGKELSDSIRIYYRNHHSAWQRKDTVRSSNKSRSPWQVELPMGHDSLLFVTVFEKVITPHSGFADQEPDWLSGHLANAIIEVVPTPHLVLQNDTINFGSIKFDECDSASFIISNFGEDYLRIDSFTTTNPKFSVIRGTNVVGFYQSDSILLGFCPGVVGCDTATLIIHCKNDTVRFVHLRGCGIDKDQRLTLSKKQLNFGKVHIGDCDTLQITVKSIGKDSILFKPQSFIKTPFQIIKPLTDTLLGLKDSVQLVVQFCPTDSGKYHSSFILSDRQDSITTDGIGTIRILKAPVIASGASLCPNSCDSVTLLCSSEGNDAILVTGVLGATILSPKTPFTMPPHSDTEIVVRYCLSSNSDSLLKLQFQSNSDSIASTTITIHPTRIDLTISGKSSFGPICLTNCDSSIITAVLKSGDSILFSNIHLVRSDVFHILTNKRSHDSIDIRLTFCPKNVGTEFDTLLVPVHSGNCDSIISIVISGNAVNSELSLSEVRKPLGAIDTGSCRIDSVTVLLSCGDPTLLQISGFQKPFTLLSPSNGVINISSNIPTSIIFQYCPDSVKNDSVRVLLSGNPFDTSFVIFGSGVGMPPNPYVHFTLQKESVLAGKDFSYLISLDSVYDVGSIQSVGGLLHYDPLLIQPKSIQSLQSLWVVNGTTIKPGEYSVTATGSGSLTRGSFAVLNAKSYYNSSSVTNVSFDNLFALPSAFVGADTGSVKVSTCSDLPGNIIVAGTYLFEGLQNNPVNSKLTFDVAIGNEGPLHIRLFSTTGNLAHDEVIENVSKGRHRVQVDVSTLSSGVYRLVIDSWGWLDGCSFVIQK